MTSKQIEELAVNYIKDALTKTGYLSPYIAENDKGPSWDGYVLVYEDVSQTKGTEIGRADVQVKGKVENNQSKMEITYPVEIADLKNYLITGGAIFFVTYISDDFENRRIYYSALTPVKIKEIFEKLKEKQKTKHLRFRSFPTKASKQCMIFASFCTDSKKQYSYSDKPLIKVDDLSTSETFSGFSMECKTLGNDEISIEEYLWEYEPSFYGRIPGTDIEVPVSFQGEMTAVVAQKLAEVSAGGKVYYKSFLRVTEKEKTYLQFGDNFECIFDASNKPFEFTYKGAELLSDCLVDTAFVVACMENAGFYLGKQFCGLTVPTTEEQERYLNSQKNKLYYFQTVSRLFDLLRIKEDLDFSKLTKDEYVLIEKWLHVFIDKKPLKYKNDEKSNFVHRSKLQNTCFFLEWKKLEGAEDTWIVLDFFRADNDEPFVFEQGRNIIFSQYSMLSAVNYEEISNIDYDVLYNSYLLALRRNTDELGCVHLEFFEQANTDVLKVLLAYDKTLRVELLRHAERLMQWVSTNDNGRISNELKTINLLQIQKRKRVFVEDEKDVLFDILEATDNGMIRVAASLLLDEQDLAKRYFKKLTQKDQQSFVELPIASFGRHWMESLMTSDTNHIVNEIESKCQ